MSAVAVQLEVEPHIELTAQEEILVRRGRAAIRRGHQEMMELGRVLVELKEATKGSRRFLAIVKEHFGLDRDLSAMWMRLASHEPFSNVGTLLHLPSSPYALDHIRKLPEMGLQEAIDNGSLRADMTVREASALTKSDHDFIHVASKPHRPESAKCGPPVAPKQLEMAREVVASFIRGMALLRLSWAEFVWLLIDYRKSLPGKDGRCLSQEALDQIISWGDGQTSHYETPHDDVAGRIPTPQSFLEWVQGLGKLDMMPR